MSVFNNDYRSGFEELKRYYPNYYSKIKEMDANLKFAGSTLDMMANGLEEIVKNRFIATASEEVIKRLEAFYNIKPDERRSLADRRKLLIAISNSADQHFGRREIKAVVLSFVNAAIDVMFVNSMITVNINRDIEDSFLLTDCHNTLLDMMPAHLGLTLDILSEFQSKVYVGGSMMRYKKEVID